MTKGHSRCLSLRRTNIAARKGVHPAITPDGYGPSDLLSAYALPANHGAGQTVAIVDAFDDPNAEADLAVYRTQFGLPACTTANGCFSKIDQRGGTTYPASDPGWAGEISLDVDMVSAIAPFAHILLVEADDNGNENLGASVDEAVALGAKFVSNSYGTGYDSTPGSGEDPSEVTDLDPFYNHPGVAVVASSGDDEFGVDYPAASQYVTSVGGTSLVRDGRTRGWSESVWNNEFGGPGSGCSLYEAKPAWQTDSGCSMRTVADVSADADPDTGVSVYDSFQADGWGVFGGTSAAAPIITATFADAGTPVAGTYPSSYPYAATASLNDVTTGNNGTCSPDYLCSAAAGYDGPTGLGTPHGLNAFLTGPHGHITGTVTDAKTHAPIGGATISAGTAHAVSDDSGHYDILAPIGTYSVTAGAFGYGAVTKSDVTVTDGGSISANFALALVPRVTVSGTVKDGSGHGWPLYAAISAEGVPGGPVYTNPYTGFYRIVLPRGTTYELHISAAYPGYQPVSQAVTVGNSDAVHNVHLPIDAFSCSAPGYAPVITGATQTFDSPSTPAGWTVTNNTAAGGWQFNDPNPRGNLTGGTGGFAIVDSDFLGTGNSEDTYLTTPTSDFSSVNAPDLSFDSDYRDLSSVADVDLSVDGGATWTNIWERAGEDARGPDHVDLALPQAAGKAQVQVRFHYTGTWAWWWEVDNVFLGSRTCGLVAGGLVAGKVIDRNTLRGLVGATVTSVDQPTVSVRTAATPADPRLGDGFYWLFSTRTGNHRFTANDGQYTAQTHTVAVAANKTTKASFSLAAGRVAVSPTRIDATVKWAGTATKTLTLHNTGTAAVTVNVTQTAGTHWLTESPASRTLAAGASAKVTVHLDAATPDIIQPGTYQASILLTANTPYSIPAVPVSMTVQPLKTVARSHSA